MMQDEMYKKLEFSSDYTVEDWNLLIKSTMGKYFINDAVLEKNMEILRFEIINFIKISQKPEILRLFEWTFTICKECLEINREQIIKIIAESFYEISNTDTMWMTNVLIQPDVSRSSERDKISYYFKVIDETLEGVFKPRLKLLDKLVMYKENNKIVDNSKYDFGRLIREFPNELKKHSMLYFADSIFSISTNQWRNISAHKSYVINKENIDVEYGRKKVNKCTILFDDFYKIVYWSQDIYRCIRLAQVLITLNYIDDIVAELAMEEIHDIRFESSLLHIIHNMQIVGFEFVSTNENRDVFSLCFKGKVNSDVKSSLIHASQCLDKLCSAIEGDKFVKDKYQKSQVCIVDEECNILASAKISIDTAMKKINSEISIDEYLDDMIFEMNQL